MAIKRKKIICFIDSFCSGGAQKQMVMLINGLSQAGYDVTTLQYRSHDFFCNLIRADVKRIFIQKEGMLSRVLHLIKSMRTHNPDVIISFLSGPNTYAAIYKFTHFWRSTFLICGERNLNINKLGLKDYFLRLGYIISNSVICNSNKQTEIIARIFGSKVQFIPNGTDQSKVLVKNNYSKNDDVYRFIIPARFATQKNPLTLLKAAKKLKQELFKVEFHWFGEIFHNEDTIKESLLLREEEGLKDSFLIHEPVKSIFKELIKYDALILPSIYEGCPNAVIDGMLSGLPILASNVSDNLMYLSHQKEFVFEPLNYEDIAEKVKIFMKLKENELEDLGKENAVKASDFFDHHKMVKRYINLFENE